MSSSPPIIDLVRSFVGANGAVDEQADSLVLTGCFIDAAAQAAWVACAHAPPKPFPAVQVYDPVIGGDIGPTEAFDADREASITIVKPTVEGVACFFFQDALTRYLSGAIQVASLRVADLSSAAAFRARGLDVGPWDIGAPPPSPALAAMISPSKLVADHVPEREVPLDLSPWLLLTPPAQPSAAFEIWKRIAARRLLSGLVSSASSEERVVYLQASGPPIFRVRADDPQVAEVWATLTQVAEWVFLSGSDIEARHRLFGGELARAARPSQDFRSTLDRAFEAAKVAYDAHIQSASRETLKALADLRKTVIEETQKVAQRAQDLTSGLGRDLAVSAAPFVLKILADAGKVAAGDIAAGFYFGAAIFLVVSFFLQWRINEAYLESQKQSRQTWMQTLYTYISPKEREEIAEAPINKAVENYRYTRNTLLVIYLALAIVLVWAGAFTLNHGTTAPSSAAQGLSPVANQFSSPAPVPSPAPARPSQPPQNQSAPPPRPHP